MLLSIAKHNMSKIVATIVILSNKSGYSAQNFSVTTRPLRMFSTLIHVLLLLSILRNTSAEDYEKIECNTCHGYKDFCDKTSNVLTCTIVPSQSQVCYTILQEDTEEQIVTKGCANKGYCESARRNSIYFLTYCKECDTKKCNSETSFTPNVFPDDGSTSLSSNLILLVCLVMTVLMMSRLTGVS
ncbi:uncharacterized protein LOC103524039 [Diaphorina citri]|uniref:Uncharacterized protein LOC103524039 n=1 Tax=Diaphorina citri TaxID=121845 RepID=A0A1S3DTE5_DIACI|nr:uncharacterized protein LOC103524039 [Diaphorina citri]XP_026689054.1 uncharacterized protein LOC103524039 [Diaphorina citri]